MTTVWAISRNTVTQAFRMKVFAFVGFFVLVVFPLLLFSLKSYGSPKAELQIVLTYSIELATLLLSLLTIFLSTWTLCREIQDRQIFSLDTKPVHRWQILLGKWLGLIIVNATLLLGMALPTYGLVMFLESRMQPDEQAEVREELLVGRRGVSPTLPDLSGDIRKEFQRRKTAGGLSENLTLEQTYEEIKHAVFQRHQSVLYRFVKTWEFRDLPKPSDFSKGQFLTVRYRFFTINPVIKKQKDGEWQIGHSIDKRRMMDPFRIKGTSTVIQEFRIPTDVLPVEGKLLISYKNVDSSEEVVIFPVADGIELLYPTQTFNQNFFNSCLLVLQRVGFLAAVGLACGTFLTFPMAITVAFTGWILCLLSNYMLEIASHSLLINIKDERLGIGPAWYDEIFRQYLQILFSIFPDFSYYNPVPNLADGREVGLAYVGACFLFLLILRGGAIALLGTWIFHTRELAKLVR